MSATHLDDLKRQMEDAVAAQDFETAGKLRDQIEDVRRHNLVSGLPDTARGASLPNRRPPAR
jgi:protein-arginine kinase activator protein McsA